MCVRHCLRQEKIIFIQIHFMSKCVNVRLLSSDDINFPYLFGTFEFVSLSTRTAERNNMRQEKKGNKTHTLLLSC